MKYRKKICQVKKICSFQKSGMSCHNFTMWKVFPDYHHTYLTGSILVCVEKEDKREKIPLESYCPFPAMCTVFCFSFVVEIVPLFKLLVLLPLHFSNWMINSRSALGGTIICHVSPLTHKPFKGSKQHIQWVKSAENTLFIYSQVQIFTELLFYYLSATINCSRH